MVDAKWVSKRDKHRIMLMLACVDSKVKHLLNPSQAMIQHVVHTLYRTQSAPLLMEGEEKEGCLIANETNIWRVVAAAVTF